jgi:hypothetical protein
MDQCIEWLKSKNYKPIDITKLINQSTYDKYSTLAEKNKQVILYFKRQPSNEIFFLISGCQPQVNYYLLNSDNYIFMVLNNTFDAAVKRHLENSLGVEADIECKICYNSIERISCCTNCSYGMCRNCVIQLSDKTSNDIKFTCPHCKDEQLWPQKLK